ncbi:MAG: 30S ribosomal protein S27e [Candidatus Lokiarchaeota archaeon]|nr:30S ribosomal protein S27e [Candidatus Lokiarchaeota archaeon]
METNSRGLIPTPKSRFLKVKCLDCQAEQVIFGCASSEVKCNTCGKVLAVPRSSKAKIKTQIIAVLT